MRFVVRQFLERSLIPESALTRFNAAIASAFRLRNSVLAEVLLIAFVYVVEGGGTRVRRKEGRGSGVEGTGVSVRVSVAEVLADTRNLKRHRQSPHPDNPPMGISTKLSYERTLFCLRDGFASRNQKEDERMQTKIITVGLFLLGGLSGCASIGPRNRGAGSL